MKKYPKRLCVQWQGEDNDPYMAAQEKAENLDDGKMAVYELVRMVEKKTYSNIKVL